MTGAVVDTRRPCLRSFQVSPRGISGMGNVDDLWGYNPEEPVSDEARRVYGLIFPLFHEYVVGEMLHDHIPEGRRDAARGDVRARLDRLVDEARFCVALGVPEAAGTWWIEHRRHRFEERHRDLRRRRRKLPSPADLWEEFKRLLWPFL